MTTEMVEKLDMPALHAYNAGMKYMQYTIRSVPDTVDRALRARADKEKVSLNQIALDALAQAAGNPDNHDLDFLFGSWVEDNSTNEALAEQRKIDPSLWK